MIQEPPTSEPYDQSNLLENLSTDFDFIAFVQTHPIASAAIVIGLIALVWILMRRRPNS
ncbi:MAG: hypothetical protein AAFR21_11970 [Pseudomonadota bacterium]